MSGRFSESRREQLATATAHGLLSATDKAKIDAQSVITSVAVPLTLAAGVLDIQASDATHEGSMSATQAILVGQLGLAVAWAALPFAANWSSVGAGNTAAAYNKDQRGWVNLKGVVTKSVALALPDTMGTLPAGFRPAAVHRWLTSYAGTTCEIFIDSGGLVRVNVGGAAAGVSLDGISFDPAT